MFFCQQRVAGLLLAASPAFADCLSTVSLNYERIDCPPMIARPRLSRDSGPSG
jgi:hypothetical protein